MEKNNVIPDIRKLFPEDVESFSQLLGEDVLVIPRRALLPVFRTLKAPPFSFNLLLDLTCVDFVASESRFEMVYHLYSLNRGRRLRIKVSLPSDNPVIESLSGLWKNADWLEREIYDMFGVAFAGHPDLRRILMYEGFEGYPLRKSYPWRKRQPRIPMEGQ